MAWTAVPVSAKYHEIAEKIVSAVYRMAINQEVPPLKDFPQMQTEEDKNSQNNTPMKEPTSEAEYIKYVDRIAGKWVDSKCAEILRAVLTKREIMYYADGSLVEINGVEALLVSQCIREILYGPEAVAEISVYTPDIHIK